MLIYMAAPYGHHNPDIIAYRIEVFSKVYASLIAQGQHMISPLLNHFILHYQNIPGDYQFWGEYSRKMLAISGKMVVLKLDGWETSGGVQDEIRVATELGLPIEYMDVPAEYATVVRQSKGNVT